MVDFVHPELRNLAQDLKEGELNEIGAQVMRDFEMDLQSRSDWDNMHAGWLRAYYQLDVPKNPPWEGSSTESLPILAEACNQFHARAFQAMFPNNSFIKGIPTGKSDAQARERGKRIGTHMSWQLLVKDKGYKRNKDRLLLALPLHGSFFTKTFYSPLSKRPVIQNVRPTSLILPYEMGGGDFHELERKSQIVWVSDRQGRYLEKTEFFLAAPEPFTMATETQTEEAHAEAHGYQKPGMEEDPDGCVIEQHRWLDLDDDGVDEPYIVWVDRQNSNVLRIAVRYDTDELGNPSDDKAPIECFTPYAFLENPDGPYGLGMGHLIGQLNACVNKLIRQYIDAATLANVGNASGIINKGLSMKKGELEFQLGKFVGTDNTIEDISKGIFQFKFPGPQASLVQMAELLMVRGDRLATVTEALTGQTDKVMQPTTVLALIEQGLQLFSAVYQRFLDSWTQELEKVYRLNRKHLDHQEYFSVLDVTGEIEQIAIGREDYEDDFQVRPVADPKMSTQRQKLARAQAEYQFANSNPLILNSPTHYYNASRRYLEAIDSQGIDEILPKPEAMLPRMDDAAAENYGAMADPPRMPPVFPDQDHDAHIRAHLDVLYNPDFRNILGDAGMAELQGHIAAHQRAKAGLSVGQGHGPERGGMAAPAGGGVAPGANSSELQPSGVVEGSEFLGGGTEAQGSA